jgi:ubiquinone/menaquinone biosynthesis C-methylase UbiE
MTNSEYDQLSSIYDVWSEADPVAASTISFYKGIIHNISGPILELGVGTGRIAIELMKKGRNVIGIDISEKMMAVCKEKTKQLKLSNKLTLSNQDMRNFTLNEKVKVAILPFRTIGHLLTLQDRINMFNSVAKNIQSGGLFIFDHYVFNLGWAQKYHGVPRLMNIMKDNENNIEIYIYDTYLYDFKSQKMDCRISIETVNSEGCVINKRYAQFYFSWIVPEEIKELSQDAGFEVIDIFGDFKHQKWNEKSDNQIWILEKK